MRSIYSARNALATLDGPRERWRFWWEDIFDDFRGCGRKLVTSESESEATKEEEEGFIIILLLLLLLLLLKTTTVM
ncbi:hypothetical protein VNO80_00526 [Phaseolus coccineus]|uniref:Uncharacterized protein n=1 Tax=Phaseolus coccineus TaxID=3886 RepID=A0AAN9RSG1_PHACN